MSNKRLARYLESIKLLTNIQCEFRSQRSTTDHLERVAFICSIVEKQMVQHANTEYRMASLLWVFQYIYLMSFAFFIDKIF